MANQGRVEQVVYQPLALGENPYAEDPRDNTKNVEDDAEMFSGSKRHPGDHLQLSFQKSHDEANPAQGYSYSMWAPFGSIFTVRPRVFICQVEHKVTDFPPARAVEVASSTKP